MGHAIFDSGKFSLELARRVTQKMTADLTDAQLLFRPNGVGNHALWNLGHLAWTDAFFTHELSGVDPGYPKEWAAIFGMKSECSADPKAYPPARLVRDEFTRQREKLLAYFAGLSGDQLAEALPPNLAPFGATKGQLMQSLAWHEGLHSGQIAACRRAQGLPPALG